MTRNVTEQLLEQVDGADFGYARHVLLCALKYMSEDDVADMAKCNELLPDDDKEDIRPEFEYLCELRDSGAINMFGAGRYLEEVFELDRREAKKVLLEWMQWVERERR